MTVRLLIRPAVWMALPLLLACNRPQPPVPNEKAAFWVLSKAGRVAVSRAGKMRWVASLKELPMGSFTLRRIDLTGVETLHADEFAAIEHLRSLELLNLRRAAVTDEMLEHFVGLECLRQLNLAETTISDRALASIGACPRLMELNLSKTRITGDGFRHLKPCWKLTRLDVSFTSLQGPSLEHLSGFQNLIELNLKGTQVSADAVESLQKALSHCRILR